MAADYRLRHDESDSPTPPARSPIPSRGRDPIDRMGSIRALSPIANLSSMDALSPVTTQDDIEMKIKKLKTKLKNVHKLDLPPEKTDQMRLDLYTELDDLEGDDSSKMAKARDSSRTNDVVGSVSDAFLTDLNATIFCATQLMNVNIAAITDPDIGSAIFRNRVYDLISDFGQALKIEISDKHQEQSTRAAQSAATLLCSSKTLARIADAVVSNAEAAYKRQLESPLTDSKPSIGKCYYDGVSLEDIKPVLLDSQAYISFRAQLLDFVHAPYETRIMAALNTKLSAGHAVFPGLRARSLAREISWAPIKIFQVSEQVHYGLSDRFKESVETTFGEVWNWWPLRQRLNRLRPGCVRLEWYSVGFVLRRDICRQ